MNNKASATDVNFLLHLKAFYEEHHGKLPEENLRQIIAENIIAYFNKQEGKG